MSSFLRHAAALPVLLMPQFTSAQQSRNIEEFATKYIDAETAAWERGEYEALENLEHVDAVFRNVDGTGFRGDDHKEAIEAFKASYNGAPITQEWHYLMGEGNVFAVSYEWIIHVPNEPLTVTGIAVLRVDDGKVMEEWGANKDPVAMNVE